MPDQVSLDTLFDKFGDSFQLHSTQLFGHEGGLFPASLLVLLQVERLMYGCDHPCVPRGAFIEGVAVPVYDAKLPFRVGVEVAKGVHPIGGLVQDHKPHAVQTAHLQIPEEVPL